jgi:hypothetical protein
MYVTLIKYNFQLKSCVIKLLYKKEFYVKLVFVIALISVIIRF